MGSNENLLKLLNQAWKVDLSTYLGLVQASVYNILAIAALGEVAKTLGAAPRLRYWALLWLATEVAVAAVFYVLRFVRPSDRDCISVGFAIAVDPESERFYRELKAAFSRHINGQGLTGVVRIRKLPSDLRFQSGDDAGRYAKANGLRVLVWGETSRANQSGTPVSEFHLNWLCQYGRRDERVIQDIEINGYRSAWMVQDIESRRDLQVVAGNLTEVSLYILARCLISTRKPADVERGVNVLKSLYGALLNRAPNNNFPNLLAARENVRAGLLENAYALAVYHYQEKNIGAAKQWCEYLLSLKSDDYLANILLARISWELSDRQSARLYTERARVANPGGSMARMNLAFFDFYNGKYGKGLNHYKKMQVDILENNNIDSVEFLLKEYDKTKKPALLFAAGWLSYNFGDSVHAKQLLGQFCENIGEILEFRRLRIEAEKILSAQI